MLILLFLFIKNWFVPQLGALALSALKPTMIILIICTGIVMLLGSVGMKISANLGSTIVGGLFRGIGWLFNHAFRGIRWLIRSIIRLIPRVYNGCRRNFIEWGLNPVLSTILAVFIAALVLILII